MGRKKVHLQQVKRTQLQHMQLLAAMPFKKNCSLIHVITYRHICELKTHRENRYDNEVTTSMNNSRNGLCECSRGGSHGDSW